MSEQITIPPGVNLRRFAGKGHSDLPRRNTPAKQLFGAGCLSWRRLAQLAQRFHPWHVQGRSFHVALCVHSQSWADNVQVNFAALPKLHFQDLEKSCTILKCDSRQWLHLIVKTVNVCEQEWLTKHGNKSTRAVP